MPGDRFPVHDCRRAAHQQLEDVVFGVGQAEGSSAGRYFAADRIERQRAARDRGRIDAARPPLQRPDASQELPKVEGLDQVVVRAGVQPTDPVRGRVAGRQH